jgi:hypothetical protein
MPRIPTSFLHCSWTDVDGPDPVLAAELFGLVADMYPICRSLTGDGVRQTLEIIGRVVPLEVHEVPSGTAVLDWTVPDEWNIRDAYIADSTGHRVVDFRAHNLHVVNYSTPVHETMSLDELRPHLISLPDRPDSVPYRTSYYDRTWGFCLSHGAQCWRRVTGVCIDAPPSPCLTSGEVPCRVIDTIPRLGAHLPSLARRRQPQQIAVSARPRRWRTGPGPPSRTASYAATIAHGASHGWPATVRPPSAHPHGLTLTCPRRRCPFTYSARSSAPPEIDRAAHVMGRADPPGAVIDSSVRI